MRIKQTIITGLILFIGLLLMQQCVNKKEITPKDESVALLESGTHYKRVNLVVADLDKSLSIYRDILGFTIHKLSESSKDSYSYPVFNFPSEAQMRFCTMDSPDQTRAIALTEVTGIDLPIPTDAPHMSASVIRVKNIKGTIEKIKGLGLETTKIKEAEDVNGDFRFYEQAFVDYDGHLIVLYEII